MSKWWVGHSSLIKSKNCHLTIKLAKSILMLKNQLCTKPSKWSNKLRYQYPKWSLGVWGFEIHLGQWGRRQQVSRTGAQARAKDFINTITEDIWP